SLLLRAGTLATSALTGESFVLYSFAMAVETIGKL
ncbi:MAG: hypothetical protein QOD94_2969, partial [Alphaproteobacteria bacterium]|nr:hypothetical protein [Alphaproteobacteria bacterium]